MVAVYDADGLLGRLQQVCGMDRALETSERLIEALRAPAVWGDGVESVRLLETHISWVLLTGEYAYKIKKPVDLGFWTSRRWNGARTSAARRSG